MVDHKREPRIAIIGGGLSGLECALALLQRGVRVDVFEAGDFRRQRHVDWEDGHYLGDKKNVYWNAAGWGTGGGIPCRVGGRSLCYHGVFLEPADIHSCGWGSVWRDRLAGPGGLYEAVKKQMQERFGDLFVNADRLAYPAGLKHVPQAARIDPGKRFEAYTPITDLHDFLASGHLQLIQTKVVSLVSVRHGRWAVINAERDRIGGEYDRCILAASAIVNMELLASISKKNLTTTVTDHFCIGMFAKFRGGRPLKAFRHKKIWAGYLPLTNFGANLFVSERRPLDTGERLLELTAVVEQTGNLQDYSTLTVETDGQGRAYLPYIYGNVSLRDLHRMNAVRAELKHLAQKIADVELVSASVITRHQPGATEPRLGGYERALQTLLGLDKTEIYCEYELPYGAFEHEACTHPAGSIGDVSISEDFQVHDLPNIFVAGPGCFPSLSEANPALTIVATSRWLGAHLADGL